jgi:hypothetical protein
MRLLFVVPLVGFMSFSLAAFMPQSVDTSRRGMAYGHLQHTGTIERVELAPIAGLRRPSARVLPNGDFYAADLEPGQYVLTRFLADGQWHDVTSPLGVRELTVTVDAGMISYAGSWAISGNVRDGLTALPGPKPAPDVLLKRLRYSLRGTGWERQIP